MYQHEGKPRGVPPEEDKLDRSLWTIQIGRMMLTQVNNHTAETLAMECKGRLVRAYNPESGELELEVNVPKPYAGDQGVRAGRGSWVGQRPDNHWLVFSNAEVMSYIAEEQIESD